MIAGVAPHLKLTILRDTRELIAAGGLVQGRWAKTLPDGREALCLAGSLASACWAVDPYLAVAYLAQRGDPLGLEAYCQLEHGMGLVEFNELPGTTLEDVLGLLDGYTEELEGRVLLLVA